MTSHYNNREGGGGKKCTHTTNKRIIASTAARNTHARTHGHTHTRQDREEHGLKFSGSEVCGYHPLRGPASCLFSSCSSVREGRREVKARGLRL